MFAWLNKILITHRTGLCTTNVALVRELSNLAGSEIVNRNPRNLERLRIAPKLQGFTMDEKPTNFWNRLVLEYSNRHVSAHIEHHLGRKVVTASTKEWAIKQFLTSTTDTQAMKVIGQVLARRCLECGLLEVHSDYDKENASQKVRTFLEQMESGGVTLVEPERYLPHRHWSREKKEDPTKVYEER